MADMDRDRIQEKIKKLLSNPPAYDLSKEKRSQFIASLYRVSDERKAVSSFLLPFTRVPVYARVAATAAVAALCVTIVFSPVYPVISNVSGTVKVYRSATNSWVYVEGNRMKLARNDIVKTFGDGTADIIMPGVYHVRIKSDSEIKLARTYLRTSLGDTKYELAKGKAFAYYKKKDAAPKKFDIGTPEAEVSVVGTDFMVASLPAMNQTWVGVLDGVVHVTGRGVERAAAGMKEAAVNVRPGEKTIVRAGEAPAKPFRLLENDMFEMQELYRIGTKPQVALLISTGVTRTRELLSLAPLYISSEKRGVLPAKVEEIAKSFARAMEEGSKEKLLANVTQFEEIVNRYPDPKYNVQFLLFIGAYYECLDEHEKAIRVFQRTIDEYPASGLASIAQCAIGIIYEEKLDDAAKAREAYRTVLSKYPASPEVEEASAGLKRLEAKGAAIRSSMAAGPAENFAKYRKEYLKGKYRTIILVIDGKVIAANYDEKSGPDYANGIVLVGGQKTDITGEVT